MNYGFIINNETCIGCHACSTACKSENEVPLGVNRTWVKSVETGTYPDVTRHFQVTRCNHCANPPCVRICPVTAMYQRDDGIVEYDANQCIGCKACLQACPYDAIYIDPDSGTAAKCHYCAHRVDLNLEPACVVVCPEHAIIAGDLDDPDTEISRMLAANKVTVRKPEQGTAPKLYYINGSDAAMHPTATERSPDTFAWADVIDPREHGNGKDKRRRSSTAPSGASIRRPAQQGVPSPGPIMIGEGRAAEQMVQVVYNAQHKVPWHWPVPAYLVTKAIASGIIMIVALALGLRAIAGDGAAIVTALSVSLLFQVATTAFLVFDLERPERFFRILLQPQWKSWLVRGAYILVTFATVTGLWWLVEVLQLAGIDMSVELVRWSLGWLSIPLAIGAAVYTAFLFGQAEGRDLWQSTLLPLHLLVQATVAGAAMLLIIDAFVGQPERLMGIAKVSFAVGLVVDLIVTFLGEFGMPHASEVAAKAAHEITHGKYRGSFWYGSVIVGHLVPLALLFAPAGIGMPIAAVLALAGLYLYEYAFVMAPQDIPNS